MPTTAFVTSGSVLTATEFNYLPRGLIGKSSDVTSIVTSTGTHTTYQAITGLSCSVTYGANRIIKVTAVVQPYSPNSVAVGYQLLRGATSLAEFQFPLSSIDTGASTSKVLTYTFAGPSSAATETFYVYFRSNGGNLSVSNFGSAQRPCLLTVEDAGAA